MTISNKYDTMVLQTKKGGMKMLTLLMGLAGMAWSYSRPVKNPVLAKQLTKDTRKREMYGRW